MAEDTPDTTPKEFPGDENTQPTDGPVETTDAGTEGLETVSYAAGQTDDATPDVPPVTEPTETTEGTPESVKDESEVAVTGTEESQEGQSSDNGLDRVLDITIGAVVVAAEATKSAVRQVREHGPDVAKNFQEKGRPIREKLAAQIKERGFGPATLPLVDPDGTDPMDKTSAVPGATIEEDTKDEAAPAPAATAEAETEAAPAGKPAVVLPPGSSAADEISLLERRVRAMESEVSPFDPERLSDSDTEDEETPADAATYVPGEWGEDASASEDDPQLADSPYSVSETDTEQSREGDADAENGRDKDNPFSDQAP